MSTDDEMDDRRRQIALFRHAVIADLDFEEMPRGELSARIVELALKTYQLPSGREKSFSERTLWTWWSDYKSEGLPGLVPASRQTGTRELTPFLLEAAITARREVPTRSTAMVIRVLEAQKLVAPGRLKRSTLDRHLDAAGASRRRLKTLGNKVFTRMLFSHPNAFWVGDYHDARILWDAKRQRFREVHLSAWVDHYSKYVPHAQWYLNEDIATLEDSYKKAVLKCGICDKNYVDNGSLYRSGAFSFAVAHIGSRRVHSKPYQSEGRGAIERFNRTIVEGFEGEARAAKIESIEQLNLFFEAWLEQCYHLVPHSATGECPADRFAQKGFTPRYADPVLIQDIFRVAVKRKVHPKTATVEAAGVAFQCESFLRGRWVRVYYDPFRLDDVLVLLNRKRVQRAFPQKPNNPQSAPERPVASPLTFDFLGALRAEYDRRIVEQAKHVSLSECKPAPGFTLKPFLDLCAQMLGKDLSPYENEELTRSFNGVGPFSEKTVRLALEHALKLRGRGLHVSVYSHYLKVFHLAALNANQE
jgi:putative transposase